MPRPTTIKDETIIRAAREVFLHRGLEGTTAEVAERADVSEGSIFKRWKTKADLFRAAMAHDVHDVPWLNDFAARVGGYIPVKQSIYQAGIAAIAFYRQLMPLMMMTYSSNPAACDELPEMLTGDEPPPLVILKRTRDIFAAEMRAGRLRRTNAEMVARLFLGAILNYVFFNLIAKHTARRSPTPSHFVRQMVETLWDGLAPLDRGRA
jgi:AcrR family transcriptional regulator